MGSALRNVATGWECHHWSLGAEGISTLGAQPGTTVTTDVKI